MNSLETYDHLMTKFPFVYPEDHFWVNVHDGKTPKIEVLFDLLTKHIGGRFAVVIVHSKPGVGAEIPLNEVCSFIAPHIVSAEIYVGNLELNAFVAVMSNGVATGWNTRG